MLEHQPARNGLQVMPFIAVKASMKLNQRWLMLEAHNCKEKQQRCL
jgi:hypothetical protein